MNWQIHPFLGRGGKEAEGLNNFQGFLSRGKRWRPEGREATFFRVKLSVAFRKSLLATADPEKGPQPLAPPQPPPINPLKHPSNTASLLKPTFILGGFAAGIEQASSAVGGACPARRGGDFRSPRKPAGAAFRQLPTSCESPFAAQNIIPSPSHAPFQPYFAVPLRLWEKL